MARVDSTFICVRGSSALTREEETLQAMLHGTSIYSYLRIAIKLSITTAMVPWYHPSTPLTVQPTYISNSPNRTARCANDNESQKQVTMRCITYNRDHDIPIIPRHEPPGRAFAIIRQSQWHQTLAHCEPAPTPRPSPRGEEDPQDPGRLYP